MQAKLYLLSVAIHLLAAMIWVGGMAFLVLVLVPSLRQGVTPLQRAALVQATGRRFRTVGWCCLGLLVLTGLTNLWARGMTVAVLGDAAFWSTPFGSLLAWKVSVVALIVSLSGVHDFLLGPRATRLLQEQPGEPETEAARRLATRLGRLNFLLSLIAVLLAVMLVRGRPW